jgi:hypothetical protein
MEIGESTPAAQDLRVSYGPSQRREDERRTFDKPTDVRPKNLDEDGGEPDDENSPAGVVSVNFKLGLGLLGASIGMGQGQREARETEKAERTG